MEKIDWNLIRSFVAVAETGNLSAAARQLQSSQPTIGRHITELEAQLGSTLFQREPRAFLLTDTGAQLLEEARSMAEAADAFLRRATGQQRVNAGPVRITASVVIGTLVLPHIAATIRRDYPEIELEFIATDSVDNLLRRDADIAVRMIRPDNLDLVARHVGDIRLMICAHETYLERRGTPHSLEDLLKHDVIGLDRGTEIIQGFAHMGQKVKRDFFPLRSDNHLLLWETVKAGCGIGFMQEPLIRSTPGMKTLLEDAPIPDLPVWLAIHRDLRKNPRMRIVMDRLTEGLKNYIRNGLPD